MKKYETYKDSGLEWLGMVPEHWGIVPLKYLLSEPLQYGANESADNCNPSEPRYIRITDITEDGKLRKSTYRTLPYQKAEGYMLKKGDILFARSGATVGKTFIFEEDYDACFAGYLIKASCNEKLLPMFLYYFTSSNSYENWKNSTFNQATIQNIGADKYCTLPIPTPSSEEQEGIINFLSHNVAQIDALISEKEKMVEDLKAYRSSLITETVTKGLDKDVKMKDSGVEWIGKMPQNWKLLKLKRIVNLKSGTSLTSDRILDEGKYQVFGGNGPRGYIDDYTNEGNFVLIGRQGALCGNINYANGKFWATEHAIICYPLKEIDTIWLGETLRAMNLNQYSISAAQPGLAVERINELLIPTPSISEQKEISSYLKLKITQIESAISEQEHQLSDLKSYKSSLITEAVTGKIDLRDWQTKKS
ncbi:restriction endonuclease subunit S [uncultured Prevotella sp.]|uniref:restriction endonuclease subunit S n=1 Tax=uncultured Prevotella sp. TaxID=159272 RepID=UPI0025F73901|nr:restriction endonuclease subunit S [uncultured Prevotella sp.]